MNYTESDSAAPFTFTGSVIVDTDKLQKFRFARDNNENTRSPSQMVYLARVAFKSGRTRSVEFRRHQLKNLVRMIEENSDDMVDALKCDLGRPTQEALSLDVDYSKNDINRILMQLDDWVKPEYPPKPMVNMLDKIRVHNDPYGVVLVIGSWNFPFTLVLTPLACAIAAGNCVIVKPSEISSASGNVLAKLLPKYLDDECYQVYQGGPDKTADLLQERFDYIFFTGSTAVGKIVYAAANKHLTPVTLEMGGKSPVYLDESVNMSIAARRILWGKCTNAGQICISPDYILCTKEVREKFIAAAKAVLREWYGDDIKASPDYGRIVSDKHYERLTNFLNDKSHIAIGGRTDASERFIEPTILVDIKPDHPAMQEEIFGPILPIMAVQSVHEAVAFINEREKPLALYIFTKKKIVKDLILDGTSSGTVVINDTIMQFAVDTLPFGGVGHSGMGRYHANYNFDTFVHKKSILEKNYQKLPEKANSIRYPPYSDFKSKFLQRILKPRKRIPRSWISTTLIFCAGIIFVICVQKIYSAVTHRSLL